MSTERVGNYPEVELPDNSGDSTSWNRARDEETRVEPGLVMEWGGWEDWDTFREHYLGAYSLDAQQRGIEKVDWL